MGAIALSCGDGLTSSQHFDVSLQITERVMGADHFDCIELHRQLCAVGGMLVVESHHSHPNDEGGESMSVLIKKTILHLDRWRCLLVLWSGHSRTTQFVEVGFLSARLALAAEMITMASTTTTGTIKATQEKKRVEEVKGMRYRY